MVVSIPVCSMYCTPYTQQYKTCVYAAAHTHTTHFPGVENNNEFSSYYYPLSDRSVEYSFGGCLL